MKYIFYYIVLCTLLISCAKDQSSPSSSKVKLVKTITTKIKLVNTGPDREIDSFAYDNQNRMVYYRASIYTGSSFTYSSTYKFSYSGTLDVPVSYFLSYSPVPPSYSIDNYSGVHAIGVNSQNQIVLDSVVPNSNPGGINRYTEYGDNMMVHTWGNFGSDGRFYTIQMDSVLTDGNNVSQINVGTNQTQSSGSFTYRWIWSYNYTYDTAGDPLYNTSASLIYFLVRGYYANKSCALTYNFNSTISSVNNSFRNNTDQNGLLQNTINQETGDSVIYKYY